jgi:hypothetical protein
VRRCHGDLEYFAAQLSRIPRHMVVLQGGMSPSARRDVKKQLAVISDAEEQVVIATGRYIGEGFDDARLDRQGHRMKWWPGRELNPRHADFQSAALPTELPGHCERRIKQARSLIVNE